MFLVHPVPDKQNFILGVKTLLWKLGNANIDGMCTVSNYNQS